MKKIKTTIAISLILIGLFAIFKVFYNSNLVTTNDAQIEQYITPINVKIPGYINEIRFTEHQSVKQGDTLLIIDDRELKISLQQAEATLLDALSGQKVIVNTFNTATNNATVYDSSIEEAELRVEKLRRDYERHNNLLNKKASTPIIVDQYKTELEMASARVEALKRQRQAALSSVNEVNQRQGNAEAAILRAKAAVEMAKLNLSYTIITAPCNGKLGRRAIEEGQLVAPGQTLTTIIPDTPRWVIANFKETQTTNLRIGQSVEISIDAIPNKTFKGYISAISSATGSKYSAIPIDNSAGNFVKIQQRIPVRIDFINISNDDYSRMAAGMMCEIKVDTTTK